MPDAPHADRLRASLRTLGLSASAIDAAWPTWWSAESDVSASARTELTFSVSRRLGLDPRSLLEGVNQPRFIWREEARFKRLSAETELERDGITSFGRSIATAALGAAPIGQGSLVGQSAASIRQSILAATDRPYVDLVGLLLLTWSVGIPALHLRIFPWPQKRMAAMTVEAIDRWAILLAKDSDYPAAISFYLAHEIAHIALDQVGEGSSIVDLDDANPVSGSSDHEETRADAFAIELLTGRASLQIRPQDIRKGSAAELARLAQAVGGDLGVEPGVIVEIFGFTNDRWPMATAALRLVYPSAEPVWLQVNRLARQQLDLSQLPDDAASFVSAVLGETSS